MRLFLVAAAMAAFSSTPAAADTAHQEQLAQLCKSRIMNYVRNRDNDGNAWNIRNNSALYVYYDTQKRCGYGYATGKNSVEAARATALKFCKTYASEKNVVIPCTLVGQNQGVPTAVNRALN